MYIYTYCRAARASKKRLHLLIKSSMPDTFYLQVTLIWVTPTDEVFRESLISGTITARG